MGTLLRSLESFDTVVITYPIKELAALAQYLRADGRRVVLDVTGDQHHDLCHTYMHTDALVSGSLCRSKVFVIPEHLATPTCSLEVVRPLRDTESLNVLMVGSDASVTGLESVQRYASKNINFFRMTDGEYFTHQLDFNLFAAMKNVDAIMLDDVSDLPIPENFLLAKGVPILIRDGLNTGPAFGDCAVYCHSDDEWERAFSNLVDTEWRKVWGDKALACVKNHVFDSKVLVDDATDTTVGMNPQLYFHKDTPKITMLVRTSERADSFKRLMDCVASQEYPNLEVIVSYDTPDTLEYIQDADVVTKVVQVERGKGSHFYNDYMNTLLDEVHDGWVFFMDDDDMLFDSNTLKLMGSQLVDEEAIHIFQMVDEAKNKAVIPPWHLGENVGVGSVGTPCFVMQAHIAKRARWDSEGAADGRYFEAVKEYAESIIRHDLVTVRLPSGANKGVRLG